MKGCPKFNDEDKVDHQTVALLATKDDKWLLSINLKHHMLTLPIGKVRSNESLWQGLCREMWEELGVKLQDVKICKVDFLDPIVKFTKTYDFDGAPVNVTTTVFEVDSTECYQDALFKQCMNMEPNKCGGIMWVNPSDIPGIIASSGFVLADCLDAALRVHFDTIQLSTWTARFKR